MFARHPEIVEVGCMAHAALFQRGRPQRRGGGVRMLMLIRELYAIERAGAALTAEVRRVLRQEPAVLVRERMRRGLEELAPTVLPKSPLAEAIGDMRGHWPALSRYAEDGRYGHGAPSPRRRGRAPGVPSGRRVLS